MELRLDTARLERTPVKTVNGSELKHLFGAGAAWLEKHTPFVNALNVFPVPDGDTGTNMLLTVQSAVQQAYDTPSHHAGETLAALSEGALLGARGNSGVILSQILNGLARSVDRRPEIDALGFARAMAEGSRAAYRSLDKPVEGTILTVMREAAEGALGASNTTDDLRSVFAQTVEAARAAVVQTPQLLPILREAGVVDAGGQGLLLIFEGASKYLNGEPMESPTLMYRAQHLDKLTRADGWGYDIQFHIRGKNLDIERIRACISSLGESALVVGDERLVKVHVHAPNPGDIIKFGAEQGPLINIMIENMQEQYIDFKAGGTADQRIGASQTWFGQNLVDGREHLVVVSQLPLATKVETVSGIATVAVVPGPGLRHIFESLGVSAIVAGGPTMNPSAQDLLHAIDAVSAEQVILLPNDKNIILAAQQAQRLTTKQIRVIPSHSIPQGIAALLAFNYQSDLETNVKIMTTALHRIRTVELTTATRSVSLNGLAVREGQPIALLNGELIAASDELDDLALEALRRGGAEDAEIVTLYYGNQVTLARANVLRAKIEREFPEQEIEIHAGGQPLYPYIISIE